MRIDIFKNMEFWNNLSQYNNDIIEIYNKDGGKGSTNWFDPNYLNNIWIRKSDKKGKFVINDLKNPSNWKLILHPNNYLCLFLINALYSDNKNILIEDVCCGMGRLVYYLSKLGFNNFSMIDNFSGVTKNLFETMMKKGNINYILNQKEIRPIVSNLSCYPWYHGVDDEGKPCPKDILPIPECEIFCFYCANVIFETIGKTLLESGYRELCQDEDCTQIAYCRANKLDEYREKLKS